MNKIKAIFLLLGISAVNICFACSCGKKNTVAEEFKKSDFVIQARIISLDTILVVDSNQIKYPLDTSVIHELPRAFIAVAHYKIELTKVYKGKTSSTTLDLYTAPSNAECGFQFKLESEYIIYCSESVSMYFDDTRDYYPPVGENIVWVNKCSRTRLKNDKEIFSLGKI